MKMTQYFDRAGRTYQPVAVFIRYEYTRPDGEKVYAQWVVSKVTSRTGKSSQYEVRFSQPGACSRPVYTVRSLKQVEREFGIMPGVQRVSPAAIMTGTFVVD